jgi:hypothetical protein
MSASSDSLAADLQVVLYSLRQRGCSDGVARCLEGLIAFTRERGPVGCRVDEAAEFICEGDPSLSVAWVVDWLQSTTGMGVGGVCH